jgi:hypothetical protein
MIMFMWLVNGSEAALTQKLCEFFQWDLCVTVGWHPPDNRKNFLRNKTDTLMSEKVVQVRLINKLLFVSIDCPKGVTHVPIFLSTQVLH